MFCRPPRASLQARPQPCLRDIIVAEILSLVTATGLILATDRFGRRLVVFAASVSSSLTLLLVGVLGQVGHTKPLQDFLIFVVCIWALGNNARESLSPLPELISNGRQLTLQSRTARLGLCGRGRLAASPREDRGPGGCHVRRVRPDV